MLDDDFSCKNAIEVDDPTDFLEDDTKSHKRNYPKSTYSSNTSYFTECTSKPFKYYWDKFIMLMGYSFLVYNILFIIISFFVLLLLHVLVWGC